MKTLTPALVALFFSTSAMASGTTTPVDQVSPEKVAPEVQFVSSSGVESTAAATEEAILSLKTLPEPTRTHRPEVTSKIEEMSEQLQALKAEVKNLKSQQREQSIQRAVENQGAFGVGIQVDQDNRLQTSHEKAAEPELDLIPSIIEIRNDLRDQMSF